MATRVDPAMYSDTPIFQALLEERKGRWPGIPMEELPPLQNPLEFALGAMEDALTPPPAMYRVQPLPSSPAPRTRPYTPLTDYDPENMPERDWDAKIDPEATAEMPLPRAVGD